MNEFFKDKRVLVTGCCGTVGSELTRQLLEEYRVAELVGIDNNESELFFWNSGSWVLGFAACLQSSVLRAGPVLPGRLLHRLLPLQPKTPVNS